MAPKLAPEDAYLSYYDVRLTREDISVLKNDWLTDNVIAFWEEYGTLKMWQKDRDT